MVMNQMIFTEILIDIIAVYNNLRKVLI